MITLNNLISLACYSKRQKGSNISAAKALFTSILMLGSFKTFAAVCDFNVVDEWNTGYKAEITLNAQSQVIDSFALSWQQSDSHSVDNFWNAELSCSQGQCEANSLAHFNALQIGQSFTFGFIAQKNGIELNTIPVVEGDICNGTTGNSTNSSATQEGATDYDVNSSPSVASDWYLNPETSSLSYISVKKDHVAEVNQFISTDSLQALNGEITAAGDILLTINLNTVETNNETRNGRLLSMLFETELLPTAFIKASVAPELLSNLEVGDTIIHDLDAELSLHAVTQPINARVLIAKQSNTEIAVSTIQPINIDSKSFDMALGIEALRTVASLSSIGEVVPVYFHLNFATQAPTTGEQIVPPEAVSAPTDLAGTFVDDENITELHWSDNSNNETVYLVRRKPIGGNWATVAELSANSTYLSEGLPEAGEFDYKVIAVRNSYPSAPTNIERVTVTAGNQLVRGQQLFSEQCAGCHGNNGEGLGSFPAINVERDVDNMINYIRDNMPLNSAASCDQQCAEDVATFIQTLWVTEATCDIAQTPVVYGARQLKILTKSEYQNSIADLLGVDFDVTDGLSADVQIGLFKNNTFASVLPSSYSNYLLVAEEIAQWASDNQFSPALNCPELNQDCAEDLINNLAPKIFRRPLTNEEQQTYLAIADGSQTAGDVTSGMQLALEGLLSSPQFLYRHELGEVNPDNPSIDNDAYELTSYEMATFLAYTYTGSTPDEQLLAAAARDELRDEQHIILHANRLASNANSVLSEFVGSWLGTADLERAAKDPQIGTGFANLVPDMKQEINQVFAHIMLDDQQSFAAFYSANFTFVNEALATHYGLSGVSGDEMQKVETSQRGGILANGAFMARWAESVESSPILRSVRVRRRMLCQDQPDPPAGTFAAREAKLAELSELLQDPTTTNRTKYHRLTEDAPCTNCHTQYINPLGFGMEDFDTLGRARTHDQQGNIIDASGELFAPENYSDISSSIVFNGTKQLGNVLSGLSSAQSCIPKQMFRYVMGLGHDEIDSENPQGTQLSDDEKSGYACAIDELTNTMMTNSPRAMFEKFGSLDAVRYRKAWARDELTD
ncbi:peptide chain release factor 2 [Saccharobesus litoralis]|uniref:Peptide chain release factor 2 n=1 Tax=Saccharobesus litoralis TaxID=2172099 RepID=A0A2S0VLK4_9ALTE|nr:DUF1592 domain-containing protein [Saccharobesus litoralis]AWB65086.1 peptide chain release factor 2 [Saccharobesus litoralis]